MQQASSNAADADAGALSTRLAQAERVAEHARHLQAHAESLAQESEQKLEALQV